MSVEALHVRSICAAEIAEPERPEGAEGGVVSGAEPVTVTDADWVAEPPVPEQRRV